MTYSLRFSVEVEDDARSTHDWYEEKRSGLGEEFLEAFLDAARGIPGNPELYEEIGDGYRRRLLHRFPYVIYYVTEGWEVVIDGLFHCARDPGAIDDELRHRRN